MSFLRAVVAGCRRRVWIPAATFDNRAQIKNPERRAGVHFADICDTSSDGEDEGARRQLRGLGSEEYAAETRPLPLRRRWAVFSPTKTRPCPT